MSDLNFPLQSFLRGRSMDMSRSTLLQNIVFRTRSTLPRESKIMIAPTIKIKISVVLIGGPRVDFGSHA